MLQAFSLLLNAFKDPDSEWNIYQRISVSCMFQHHFLNNINNAVEWFAAMYLPVSLFKLHRELAASWKLLFFMHWPWSSQTHEKWDLKVFTCSDLQGTMCHMSLILKQNPGTEPRPEGRVGFIRNFLFLWWLVALCGVHNGNSLV